MGWDKGRYYTQSRKVNGRVVRKYIGCGPVGVIIACMDASERHLREATRLDRKIEFLEVEQLDATLAELCAVVESLARTALLAAGFHQHKRGPWRKRRTQDKREYMPICENRPSEEPGGKAVTRATKSVENDLPRTPAEVDSLVKRAEMGDASTVPVLRRWLDDPRNVVSFGGDLARQAERAFVSKAAGDNLLFREALLRKLEMLRAELAGPDPSPLERLLVERVVACWLQVQDADTRYAQAVGLHGSRLDDYQRRMDRSHRRYLSAIKALALVRKLALPVLQVNIARQQVNYAGGG